MWRRKGVRSDGPLTPVAPVTPQELGNVDSASGRRIYVIVVEAGIRSLATLLQNGSWGKKATTVTPTAPTNRIISGVCLICGLASKSSVGCVSTEYI